MEVNERLERRLAIVQNRWVTFRGASLLLALACCATEGTRPTEASHDAAPKDAHELPDVIKEPFPDGAYPCPDLEAPIEGQPCAYPNQECVHAVCNCKCVGGIGLGTWDCETGCPKPETCPDPTTIGTGKNTTCTTFGLVCPFTYDYCSPPTHSSCTCGGFMAGQWECAATSCPSGVGSGDGGDGGDAMKPGAEGGSG